ncbi:MAG: DUF4093 domain-containing protein [Ruminococcaceae bacterium]|nr:DUF4093 domain-containing protein [Oscillospiraceae bacterium]
MDKLKINMPVIVEGKYDKIKLSSVIDATVISTDGFGIFKKKEKDALIKKLAERSKIIVFTDSDGAGLVIRNHFSGIIPKDRLIHIYTPQIKGKEKRKTAPSKEGYLGVEGQDTELLLSLFRPFAEDAPRKTSASLTKYDLYEMGLSGREESKAKRTALARVMGLPSDISANAMLEAVNLLYTEEEFMEFLRLAEEKMQ